MSYPILYQAGETNFNHLGLGILKDTISAVVSEDSNGKFELDLVYAYNNKLSKSLLSGNIIKVDAGNVLKGQLFTIAQVSKTLDGKISVHAEHISYIMQDLTLKPKTVVYQQDAQNALKQLLNAIKETDHGFTVVSDISTISSSTWSVPDFKTPRDVLAGVDGSILDNWGGEYRFDNRRISLLEQRGSYANTVIAYGRNLLDFEQETSILETYTSIYPVVVKTEKDAEVTHTLPELAVDSQYLDKYANRRTLLVDFSDKFDDKNPYSDDKLRVLANTYIKANKVGIPKVTMTIKTLDLAKMVTDDFKAGRVERLDLADTVKVYFDRLGITTEAKVVGVKWNVLKESYDEYVLGERKATFGTVIRGGIAEVKAVADSAKKDAITALVSADGKNTNYYGNSSDGAPTNPKKGDIWFVKDGDKTIIKTWNGSSWVDLVSSDWQEIFNAKLTEELSKAKVELDAALAEKDAALAELDEKIADELVIIDDSIAQAKSDTADAKKVADDAVDKANTNVQAIEANTQLINDVNAIANTAKSQAQTAATNAQIAQNNAGTAMSNAQTALDNYNNLAIGGRNFLLGTADPVVMIGNGGTNQIPKNIWFSKPTLADLDIAIGDDLYFSVDIEISGSNFSGVFRPCFGTTAWINLTPDSANYSITKAEVIKWRVPLKVLNANWLSNNRVDFRLDDVPSTVTIKATNMKLERGTKYSDWSPAPEDTIVEITNIKGELNQKVSQTNFNTLNGTVTNQATQINQNKNDIELRATKTDVNTLIGRVTSAEGSISTVAGQIALKANQADVNTTNGKVSSLESSFTVQSGQISALNTKTDGQTTQIGSLQSSYDGLTSTISSVKSDLDNMVIGGTNILATTTEDKTFQGNGAENQWAILSLLTKNSLADYGLKVGDKVTFSATCEISGSNFSGILTPRLRTSWLDIQPQQITKAEKIRYNTTITMNESRLANGTGVDFRADNVPSTVNMKWSNLKLEIGDKATYYSPAPEEKASQIQVTQMAQDLDGFKTTVASTYADKVSVASQITQSATAVTSNVQSWANNKLTAYSTTQQTATSITNAVASKADKTQITQLSDQITSTVTGITNESLLSTQMISSTTLKHPNYPDMPMVKIPVTNGESYTVSSNQPNEGTATVPTAHVWFLKLPSTAPNTDINGVYDGKSITLPALSDKIYIVFRTQDIADRFISGKYWVKVTKTPASQSQITQLVNDINLRVTKNSVVNQINISPESILIAGNKVQITGQTYIENGVIENAKIKNLSASKLTAGTIDASLINVTKINASNITTGTLNANRIAANSITATHISVSSLSALSANLGTVTAGTINAATVNIININANSITTGTLNADRIGANSITADKIKATSLDLFNNDTYTNVRADGMRIQSKAQIVFGNWRDSSNTLRTTQGVYIGGFGGGTKHLAFTRSNGTTFMLRAEQGMDYGTNQNVRIGHLNIYDNTQFWESINVHGNFVTSGYIAMGGAIQESSIQYSSSQGTMNFRVPGGRSGSYFWFNQRAVSEGSFDSKSKLSLKNVKGNYRGNALAEIVNTDIAEYSYKNDPKRRQLSPIIDDINEIKKYHLPDIINDGESVNLYAMGSLSWLAIKQLAQKLENIEEKLDAIA